MDEINIIKLHSDRWEEYKNLRLEALKSDPDAFGLTYQESVKKLESEWREPLELTEEGNGKWMLFAELNGKMVGMVSGTTMTKIEGGVKIRETYVSKDARGKGIGKKLVLALLDELKKNSNVKVVALSVFTSQEAAIGLYESLGFVEKERYVEKFPSGLTHDTIYMEKTLNNK